MINRNFRLFKIYKFFNGLEPLSVFISIYFYQITGSFATAVAVRSVETIVCSVSEIPVGLISDNIGRKKTSIITGLFMTLASLFWAAGGTFNSIPMLFFGGFLGGLANAFYSGSFNALMYETCEQAGRKEDFAAVVASAGASRHVALAIGTVIALIVSGFYNLTILAWVAVLANLGELITSLFFQEPLCPNRKKDHPWTMLKNSIGDFKKSQKLRRISMLDIFDESLHWSNLGINSLYFQTIAPLWAINVATFIKHIFSALGFSVFKKFKKTNMFKILTLSSWLETAVGLVTILINSVFSPFIWAFASFFSSLKEPAATVVIQHELNPKQRATMDSIISLLSGILSGVSLYLVGVISDHTSVFLGFSVIIFGKFILGFLYGRLAKKYKN